MRDAGVTTMVCACNFGELGYLTKAAAGQGYFPEWVVSTYFTNDSNYPMRVFVSDEALASLFGVGFVPRQNRPVDEPSFWAEKEVNPAYGNAADSSSPNRYNRNYMYRSMLL